MRTRLAALVIAALAMALTAVPVYGRGTAQISFSCTYTGTGELISVERYWPADNPTHWRGAAQVWTTVSGDPICTGTTLHVTNGDWPFSQSSKASGSTKAWNHLDLDAPYAGSGWDYRAVVRGDAMPWEGQGFGEFERWQVRATGYFVSDDPFLFRLDFMAFQTGQ
jgi:hypothetical protein